MKLINYLNKKNIVRTTKWTALVVPFIIFGIYSHKEDIVFDEVSFSDFKDWESQDFLKLKNVALKNCSQISSYYKSITLDDTFGNIDQWNKFCVGLTEVNDSNDEIKDYFEQLTPIRIKKRFEDNSLFTGYFSPILKGSFKKSGEYKYPLYKKPDNLIYGNLMEFFPDNEDLKYKKIYARLDPDNGKIVPFYSRKEIENSNVLSEKDIIAWIDNKIDAFILQIQGSGKIKLDSGETVDVGYSSQNGHKYYSIGRYFIQEGIMDKDNVNMQSIKSYLMDNPDKQDEILQQNQSYIFFDLKKDGPFGAFGIVLTPNYSIAVDRNYVPLGLPVFIQTKTSANNKDFNRLMFAQDVGGAIKGEVRVDIYFGEGEQSELFAGMQNNQGKLFVLSAKNI